MWQPALEKALSHAEPLHMLRGNGLETARYGTRSDGGGGLNATREGMPMVNTVGAEEEHAHPTSLYNSSSSSSLCPKLLTTLGGGRNAVAEHESREEEEEEEYIASGN